MQFEILFQNEYWIIVRHDLDRGRAPNLKPDTIPLVKAVHEQFFSHRGEAKVLREPGGKPFIMDEKGQLYCSISHTSNAAFCVISTVPVGIDAELKERVVIDALQKRIKHPDENLRMSALEQWVIKEAVLKLKGTGLRFAMNKLYIHQDEIKTLVMDRDNQFQLLKIPEKKHHLFLAIFEDALGKE